LLPKLKLVTQIAGIYPKENAETVFTSEVVVDIANYYIFQY
jgi:hypothetical protein